MEKMLLDGGWFFQNFTRMSSTDFAELLSMVGPIIRKVNTNMREAIPEKVRLAICLRYLASGDSYRSLMYTFKISDSTISLIVPEVCNALNEVLKGYVKVPSTEAEWLKIAKEFDNQWNFPHCIGALDGKHVQIQCQANSGSSFYNYKGTFSIVLMAIVNANYKFIYAHVGSQGRMSDGGVFQRTSFCRSLLNNALNIPKPIPLVADDAFPLTASIMKPFPVDVPVGSPRRIYNYRLTRARRIVENAFGLLSAVFRIFRKPIAVKPDTTEALVFTCIHLHNFLRRHAVSRKRYSPSGTFDIENVDTGEITPGSWRRDTAGDTGMISLKKVPRKAGNDAKLIREEFMNYFMSPEGSLSWQESIANK
nr:unnamed protein product [Callosobruchus analis]